MHASIKARIIGHLIGFTLIALLLCLFRADAQFGAEPPNYDGFCGNYGGIVDITWESSAKVMLENGQMKLDMITYHVTDPLGIFAYKAWDTSRYAWYGDANTSMLHGWETLDMSQRDNWRLQIWQSGIGTDAADQARIDAKRQELRAGLSPAELSILDETTAARGLPLELSCEVEIWTHPELPGLIYPIRWSWERRYGAEYRAQAERSPTGAYILHPDYGWYINDVALWAELQSFAWPELKGTYYYTPPA